MEKVRWQSHWGLKFGRNVKRVDTKAHTRFERYSAARTVAEALNLGATFRDLDHDYTDDTSTTNVLSGAKCVFSSASSTYGTRTV